MKVAEFTIQSSNVQSRPKFAKLLLMKGMKNPHACCLSGLVILSTVIGLIHVGSFHLRQNQLHHFHFQSAYNSFTGYRLQLRKPREKWALSPSETSDNVTQELQRRIDSLKNHLQETMAAVSSMEEKIRALENSSTFMKLHMSQNVQYFPLTDKTISRQLAKDGIHPFMSSIRGRGMQMGTPEFFFFPSNMSAGRILCIKGNGSSNGDESDTQYSFVYSEALPPDAVLLEGYTLISENSYDFVNPWHSLTNFVPFFYWKMESGCSVAKRLVLFHMGQLRLGVGSWIRSIMVASGLRPEIESLSYGGRPVCFEKAVVNRMGLHRVKPEFMFQIFGAIRCNARRMCNIKPESERHIMVTLVLRMGGRAFKNETVWRNVIKSQCESRQDCKWSVMYAHNLTFCQQVEAMSKSDIVVSAHGAQLSNMIFMSPGGRILEMFPKGWLELAGPGQHVYRELARMAGLKHEGYWRDPNTPDCPYPHDRSRCMSFYKNQNIGMNSTYVADWLGNVIQNFTKQNYDLQHKTELRQELGMCRCSSVAS